MTRASSESAYGPELLLVSVDQLGQAIDFYTDLGYRRGRNERGAVRLEPQVGGSPTVLVTEGPLMQLIKQLPGPSPARTRICQPVSAPGASLMVITDPLTRELYQPQHQPVIAVDLRKGTQP